ncbi:hypothetical protein AHAS_Ahas05G0089200 [Arachis hypogaea]
MWFRHYSPSWSHGLVVWSSLRTEAVVVASPGVSLCFGRASGKVLSCFLRRLTVIGASSLLSVLGGQVFDLSADDILNQVLESVEDAYEFYQRGYSLLGFLKKDTYNYADKMRRSRIANGDANATLVYFEGKVIGDPMYVARYNHKKDERLGNMVWIDGHSRSDFQCFGDVLAFDSTYRKNKYKRPIVIFSGSNNHKQTTIFGFGLLIDEMVSSYRWMLQNIGGYVLEEVLCSCYRLRQNDDKSCEVSFTGGTHRLCTWHVEKNAMSNGKDEHLRSLFNRWLYWT